MYKTVLGNTCFEINENGDIRSTDGAECTPPVIDNKITLMFYGERRTLDLRWLTLITHFGVSLPSKLKSRVFDINFINGKSFYGIPKIDKIMVFSKPIYATPTHRVIPNFTRYAISAKGELLDLKNNKRRMNTKKTFNVEGGKQYRYYNIITTEGSIPLPVHRLVALAWVKNNNPEICNHVDHINGDIWFNHKINLEWVTHKTNITRGVNLNTETFKSKTRCVKTGEITVHDSVSDLCRFIGITVKSSLYFKNRKTNKPFAGKNGIFEVRFTGDLRDWGQDKATSGRFLLKLYLPDGTEETFHTCKELRKRVRKLGPLKGKNNNVHALKEAVEKSYSGVSVEIINDTFLTGPYQAMELKSGLIVETSTMRELGKKLNLDWTSIRNCIQNARGDEFNEHKGYIFRVKTEDPWDVKITDKKYEGVCIYARKVTGSKVYKFDSIKEASRHFKVSPSTVKYRLISKSTLKGFELSKQDFV